MDEATTAGGPGPHGAGPHTPEARGPEVRGVGVDPQTRCAHYAGPLDVVALRFDCCDPYWPCHRCHAELADHPSVPVPRADFGLPRVLCGACRSELSVHAYRAAGAATAAPACPACGAGFNPGCSAHAALYFEVGAEEGVGPEGTDGPEGADGPQGAGGA